MRKAKVFINKNLGEDVSMRLAASVGIIVPCHGMIYARDGSLSYIIKRFDRFGHGQKLAVEDFAQLSGHSRDTKYNSSRVLKYLKISYVFAHPGKLIMLAVLSFFVSC